MLRVDKFLADMGVGTRQEVKKKIRQGRVTVDGEVCNRPEQKVDEKSQEIAVDGEAVDYIRYEYFMLNKPAGVVSATEDRHDRTVIDLIVERSRKDLFPVGRLDKDTEGLLLITNDGDLSHRLLSPSHHVDKCYYARIQGEVTEEDVKLFSQGVNIGTEKQPEWTRPGKLEILVQNEISEIRLIIQEGKFHQIKRMFRSVGKEVIYLKRERMGSLVLDRSLKVGEYRKLTDKEIEELYGEKSDVKR